MDKLLNGFNVRRIISSLWFRQNFEQNLSSSPRWIITLVQGFPALAPIVKRDVRDHVQRVEFNEVLQENVELGVLHRPAKFFSHLPWPLRSLGLVAVQHRQPTRAAEFGKVAAHPARSRLSCLFSAFTPAILSAAIRSLSPRFRYQASLP